MAWGSGAEVTWKITEQIAILSTNPSGGWHKELNRVSWNGREPKLDLRDWSPEHDKMGKGVTLSDEEAHALFKALGELLAD